MSPLKCKRLDPRAYLPQRQTEHSAGFDLYAMRPDTVQTPDKAEPHLVPLGFAVEIPNGHVGLVTIRSGISTHVYLANGVGVIDSDYRGEVCLKLSAYFESYEISRGDRIAQMVVVPLTEIGAATWVDALSDTERGAGGFGSTGR